MDFFAKNKKSVSDLMNTHAGANGDTELFEKPSYINGFETFGQQIFLLLTS